MQGWVQIFSGKVVEVFVREDLQEKTCQVVFFVGNNCRNFFVGKILLQKAKEIVDSNEERNGFGEGRGTLRTWTVRPGKWSLESQGLTGDGLSF